MNPQCVGAIAVQEHATLGQGEHEFMLKLKLPWFCNSALWPHLCMCSRRVQQTHPDKAKTAFRCQCCCSEFNGAEDCVYGVPVFWAVGYESGGWKGTKMEGDPQYWMSSNWFCFSSYLFLIRTIATRVASCKSVAYFQTSGKREPARKSTSCLVA